MPTTAAHPIQLGLNAFGDVPVDGDGRLVSDAEAVRVMVEEAVRAERVGLDVFSIGEHYRPEQVDSASTVALGAIAGRTERIRVGTAVAVLSTQDPVRLYHQFATLDAASSGRASLVLGRASSTESFPLFGFSMEDYDQLFEENLELFLALLDGGAVTWSGLSRPALDGYRPRPRLAPGSAAPWIGIGGSPQSVLRAARHGLPLMMAVIGGAIERFAGHSQYYRDASAQLGHEPGPIGLHSIGHIAATDAEAVDTFWPVYRDRMATMARERGFPRPDRAHYLAEVEHGALFVGSPETVARKILGAAETLGLSRFDMKYDTYGTSVRDRAQTVELLGAAVGPLLVDARAPVAAGAPAPDRVADPRDGLDAVSRHRRAHGTR